MCENMKATGCFMTGDFKKPLPHDQRLAGAVSVEEMRAYDAWTIEHLTPGRELMHRAAIGLYESVRWAGMNIAIVCGSGNNGGDGFALACIIKEREKDAQVRIFRTSGKLSEDGAYYFAICKEMGIPSELWEDETSLPGYDIVVDCILGTGFRGVPEGTAAAAIRAVNASGAFVVSADINSGMNGDTGEGCLAVRSDLTVSIGFFKTGHFLGEAPQYIGALVNADIGIVRPPEASA